MPSDLERASQRFRSQLLRKDAAAANAMVQAYGGAWQRIRERLDGLTTQIDEARKSGQPVSMSWLFQQRRLQSLQEQTEAELRQFSGFAETAVRNQQREAVHAAERNALELVQEALVEAPATLTLRLATSWSHLPSAAVEDLVGFASDGSPLKDLFDSFGPEGSQAVRRALINGVATGQGPRQIARQVRDDLGIQLTRALTISRTETLRSYREASRRSYQANDDVVEGWTWLAGLSGRTCASCLAMNGTVHPLSEGLDSHPNCRCAMVPRTKSWDELLGEDSGVPDTRPEIASGEAWFERQPAAVQEEVLGKAGAEAYRKGAVTLPDFVGVKESRRWGRTRYARSLKDARAAAKEREE